jgi:hypothetical protein
MIDLSENGMSTFNVTLAASNKLEGFVAVNVDFKFSFIRSVIKAFNFFFDNL